MVASFIDPYKHPHIDFIYFRRPARFARREQELRCSHLAPGIRSILAPLIQEQIDDINDIYFVRTTPGEFERRLTEQSNRKVVRGMD